MKRATIFFMLVAGVFISASLAWGQGRSHHNNHNKKDKHDSRDHGGKDSDHDHGRGNDRDHYDYRRHDNRDYHHHDYSRRGRSRVYAGNHRHSNDRTVVAHHHYTRPRYVYYRDYNVYYDWHRNVYITYSGRSWTMSTTLPVCMARVNIERTTRWDVDYYDDDFPVYLERRRPSYASVYSGR